MNVGDRVKILDFRQQHQAVFTEQVVGVNVVGGIFTEYMSDPFLEFALF